MGKAIIAGEKTLEVQSKTDKLRVMDAEILIHALLPPWKRILNRMMHFPQFKAESDWQNEIDRYRRGFKKSWFWQ